MEIDAQVVIGSNYGDEGKGTVVARLAKDRPYNTLNILTNGGAQRGHSILTKDGSITYQHFGSGTFYGAETFYCDKFILNPAQFAKEWHELFNKEWSDPESKPSNIFRDPRCMWTTIWDMMANRMGEELRKRTASCGMGIWNTIRRYKAGIYMRFDDFMNLSMMDQIDFLTKVKKFYEDEIEIPTHWKEWWYDYSIMDHFIMDCHFMKEHTISGTLQQLLALRSLGCDNHVSLIFENGQGLLLKDTGQDTPDTTPSDTGATYALEIIQGLEDLGLKIDTTLHYVTRPYLTRHGDGMIFNSAPRKNIANDVLEDRTNKWNSNQGEFRYGHLDIGHMKDRIEEDARKYKYVVEVTHCDEMDRESEFNKLFGYENVRYIDTPMV